MAITGGRRFLQYGRLADGRTLRDAEIDADNFTKRTVEASADNREFRYEPRPIRRELLKGADSTVLLVQEGAAVLLFLAVLNLASLLLAWGFERQQEIAVRQALGAGSMRVIRILLLQSLFVVGTGAVIGAGVTSPRGSLAPRVGASGAGVLHVAHLARRWGTRGERGGCGDRGAFGRRAAGVVQPEKDLGPGTSLGRAIDDTLAGRLRWQQGMVVLQAALSVVILGRGGARGGELPQFAARARRLLREGCDRRARGRSTPSGTRIRHRARQWVERLIDNLSREPTIAAAAFSSTLPGQR